MQSRVLAAGAGLVRALTLAASASAETCGGGVHGTGRYASVQGAVKLTLVNLSSHTSGGVTTGRFRLVIRTGSCRGACPAGRITGSYRKPRAAPDRGQSETLTASGRLSHLGRVR